MPWINGQSGATRISNGGGIVVVNADGSVGITPATGTGVLLGVAPPATNRYALVQIGNGPVDGVTAGHYVGSASGGGYGANFASGYGGDLLRLQVAGVDKIRADQFGNVFIAAGSVITAAGAPSITIATTGIVVGPSGNGPTAIPLIVTGQTAQTADLFRVRDQALNPQFGIANVGSGAAPVWALRVRAVANAESMAQLHTLGAYTGRAVQYIDDAGATIGWAPLYG